MNNAPQKPADVMATERTRMAADRTLMAWTRTALSMIGFGFTIFKFLESMQSREVASRVLRQHSPQAAGLTLIGIGVFALVVACIQHWQYVAKLQADEPYRRWDLGLVVAVMIASLGLVMFVSIMLGAGPLG